ncbi:glycoside hydrolase family 51 protein [Acidomyces richmondensis BFW]|nr:MAG: glycoside hydrolase family 51 protein [Acidomyces sp. 'richmondensis']KYG45949.1 glycoside hydrolase family 51 protein [Acidomyces richmondensis BFW]
MLSTILSVSALAVAVQAVTINVASSGGNATSPYQYGIMFEDINNSGDGGVYAELIQNRAFQGSTIYPTTLDFWNALGGAQLSLQNLSNPLSSALPTSMQVTADSGAGNGTIGFSNEGFWGFPVVAGWEYTGSFWVYGELKGNIHISLVSDSNDEYAAANVQVSSSSSDWMQYNYTFSPSRSAPNSNNTLNFTFAAADMSGPVNFNLLSLFPPTYNNRPNGLRVDLMEAMAGLNPSFFRAPGGNNVEGNAAPYWWNWTQTIGPLRDRPGYPGTWGYENTDGLGLIEYMLWAQDLKMEPVLAVWDGLYLDGTVVPEDELQTYVNAALDELEFLMGDASTPWGAKREALGYGPFQINFVEVGNEDSLNGGAPTYTAYRFPMFYNAIHDKYPDITIIASFYDVDGATPPYNAAGDFHEYAIPLQMSSQFGFFDNYTAAHPLLLGEYAVIEYDQPGITGPSWVAGAPRAYFPFWYGSVAEAIYLLGAERNSNHIIGASYAPGFMNLNRWEWIPDMIEFDAYPPHTTLSTSYHVVQLLSGTRITENLPMTITDGGFDPSYFVAGRSAETGAHIAKFAVYNSSGSVDFSLNFDGVGRGASGQLTYLTAPMNASNPVGGNIVQKHVETVNADQQGTFKFDLPEYSVAVFEIGPANCGWGHNYVSPGSRSGWKGFKSW